MGDTLLLLVPIIGLPVVALAIASPFLMIWYQNKRNSFFKKFAEEYKLKYIQNYPYKTFLANPPVAARSIEGTVNGAEVKIGDYIMSQYWWSFIGDVTTGMQTRLWRDGKENSISLPIFWKLASEKKIAAFLKNI